MVAANLPGYIATESFTPPLQMHGLKQADVLCRRMEAVLEVCGEWNASQVAHISGLCTSTLSKHHANHHAHRKDPTRLQQHLLEHSQHDTGVYNIAASRIMMDESGAPYDTTIFSTLEEAHAALSPACQPLSSIPDLYLAANRVKGAFDDCMRELGEQVTREHGDGCVELRLSPLKHLSRILEKAAVSLDFPDRGDGVLDIVRCLFVCSSLHLVGVVAQKVCQITQGTVVRVKDRVNKPTAAGWRDVMINLAFAEPQCGHRCPVAMLPLSQCEHGWTESYVRSK